MISFATILSILSAAIVIIAAVIALVRLTGLRSFSKMSAFDFAITVAIGSTVASTVMSAGESVLIGVLAVLALLSLQWGLARARRRWGWAGAVLDNKPLLIMRDGQVIEENLVKAALTMDDVRAKLREANVLAFNEVRAMVFETTGDISVIHGDGPLEEALLEGVETGTP